MKLKSLKLGTALAVCLSAVSVLANGPQMPAQTVLVDKAVEVSASTVKKYIGHVEAIEEVALLARVSGTLEEIKFEEGHFVEKGQLLFVIEDTTYRAKVEAAQAAVAQLEAEIAYAKSDHERQTQLIASKAVSTQTFENAKRAYLSAEAKLKEAKALLLDAENNLSYTKIYARISGKIGKVTYTEGNYITPSSGPLATIVQMDPVYVRFSISEYDFLNIFGTAKELQEHGNVSIKLADGSDYAAKGKITLVDNKVDSDTGSILLWATFPNADKKLTPGGYVTMYLSHATEKVNVGIPVGALLVDAQGSFMWVIDESGNAVRRPITRGEVKGKLQLITSGLKVGETVVTGGTHKVRPGVPLNLKFAEK